MERTYIIPLRKVKSVPRTKRAPRAIRFIREFLKKHMKSEDIILDSSINEKVWERGIQKIPTKIKIKAIKEEDGTVKAELAE
ncbi:50S ribosomal protein L31e [Methanothermobacter tenebrarum]|uniref:Large ribosomal subunit protein eL31 n=1 Tax=Methanothermobacter tenebrarum TaxID=680118 RepID=A0A328P9F7_9EURY|nr:50S ribosomal protein L31e [Methanothermobacter tenebrarum]MBC7100898.1 50S ribosomal protein L31e [Methanobacteriales archaeon]MBC7118637.1 50S ribosomal protein L31e [Methanobacteriaceae archaeon]NPV64038.1 50S ribosomal protein L31e [Methanobacteriaceae archaeon]RAO79208.1 50S ribosomal protein L31e [Methanothermobacter tenebrarum]